MKRVTPTTLIPLGSGPLMPALVLGYEVLGGPPDDAWARWTGGELPAWWMRVEQQAGGYCMSYWSVVGAVLRLEANAHHATRDPAPLISAFHAMAEDPRPALIRRSCPELVDLCGTRGELYSPADLATLSGTLGAFFDLPRCEWGMEAYVRFEPRSTPPVIGWRRVEALPGTIGIGEDWGTREPQ